MLRRFLPLLLAACHSSAPPPASMDSSRDVVATGLSIDLGQLSGTATIQVVPSSTSTGLSLEAEGLTVQSVKDDSGQALNYAMTSGRIDIGLAEGADTVTIAYTFSGKSNFDGWLPVSGVTFIWPYFCGNLFPCHSNPDDGTTFTLALTDTTKTAVFPTAIPAEAPSYMLAWAVGDYTYRDLGTTDAGTDVGVYYLPGEDAAASAGTAHLKDSFDWYEKTLGPYRFGSKVASVAASWGPGAYGGMEHHPYWHVGTDSMSDEETHVHEAAHGWFGDGIRIACWEDFVLSEGTVSYLAGRALGATAGSTFEDQLFASYATRLSDAMQTSTLKIARPDGCNQIDVLNDGLFTDIPYMKGALFLRAVEKKVGSDAILMALRDFYTMHAGGTAGEDDLVAQIKTTTGYDATACAQAWLKTEAVPTSDTCP